MNRGSIRSPLNTPHPEYRSAKPWHIALLSGLAAVISISATPAWSQVPPPLGPVATLQQATTPELGIGALRLLVQGRAQQVVDKTNADLAAQGKSSRASVADVTAWSPYRTATEHVDSPNQYIVRAPFGISIHVSIPWAADRTIYIPLDINAVCDGWSRSAGLLRFFSAPGPASIEGGNIFEDILHLRDLIDANVRNSFAPPTGSEEKQLNDLADFKGRACATIGTSNGGGGVNFESIIWSHPSRFHNVTPQQRIEVTPLILRRLVARRLDTGTPIGDPIENVSLQTYANFHAEETAPMAMRENDQIALNQPAMVLYGEPTTSLVVIGNVRNSLLTSVDSAFLVSTKSADYSPARTRCKSTPSTGCSPGHPCMASR